MRPELSLPFIFNYILIPTIVGWLRVCASSVIAVHEVEQTI
jgi:hypothetical protein